jgi:hypothetical protein
MAILWLFYAILWQFRLFYGYFMVDYDSYVDLLQRLGLFSTAAGAWQWQWQLDRAKGSKMTVFEQCL